MKTISKHMKDKKVIGESQHGFTKGKSGLTNLTAFYNEVAGLTEEEKAVDVFYFDFIEAFNTVSRNILIDKLRKCVEAR